MTHQILVLLHVLASSEHPRNVSGYVALGLFADADIERAIEWGLVERVDIQRVHLDRYWLRLSPKGSLAAEESFLVVQEVA